MTAWEEVRDLIEDHDLPGLGALMAVLDDAERQEVARELPRHLKALRRELGPWGEPAGWAEPMRVAGAGSFGGTAAVAAWLNRRDFVLPEWRSPADSETLVEVISARDPQWQADLVARLTLRIRNGRSPGAPLVMTLLRRTGVTPPQHDPLVVAWVAVPPSASQLREDPLLDVLLPRIFEAQGVGRALLDERSSPLSSPSWLGALAVLTSEGRVSRKVLLDGCVNRFLRGGDALDLRFFTRLHEVVEPTYAEVESRARDYLRLLPAAPGPVAELSLKHLRRLDRLDPADVTEALEGLLFRAEGGLVRTGLTWLDQAVRQAPERADEFVPALVTALGHEAYAVQEKAVRLVVKHARHLTPLGAETLRAVLTTLPPDLGGKLAAAVGGEAELQEEPETFVPGELAEPEPPAPFPRLPGTVVEFATRRWADTWQAGESWLAGFVRFAAEDREALRAALSDVSPRATGFYRYEDWYSPQEWFTATAAELVSPGADPGTPSRLAEDEETRAPDPGVRVSGPGRGVTNLMSVPQAAFAYGRFGYGASGPRRIFDEVRPDRLPRGRAVSAPHRFLLRRCAEVLAALTAGELPPILLATPTSATGHLDPAEFLNRLEAVEAAGGKPLPADFQQALLRLPRTADPEIVARAGRLTSEAGRRAARWLKDGLADPETGVRWKYSENANEYFFDEREPSGYYEARPVAWLKAEPTGLPLVDELLAEPPSFPRSEHGRHMSWWSSVLPSHREVVAVNYLPHLMRAWDRPQVSHDWVEQLASGEGPAGDATALLLAFFLAQEKPAKGVRLLLSAAARGDLPVAALGRQLAPLVRLTPAKLPHVTAALEDAARDGAHREVWEVIRAALPHLLPRAGLRPYSGVTDLIAFGVRAAGWAEARGEIPEITAAAGRRSSSVFTRECRRLRDLLARP